MTSPKTEEPEASVQPVAQQTDAAPENDALVDAEAQEAKPEEQASTTSDPTSEELAEPDASHSPKKGSKSSKSKKGSKSRKSATPKVTSQDNGQIASAETEPAPSDEQAQQIDGAPTQQAPQNADNQGTGAAKQREDSSSAESSTTQRSRRPRSSSTNKELAQLGLASFGDGEEQVAGPRRSRRAANGSPDPKGKKEKDSDEEAPAQPQEASRESHTPPVKVQKTEEEPTTLPEEETEDHAIEGQEDVTMESVDLVQGDAEGEAEGGDEGVTRCVCGSADENVGLMIQCETCKCWQHCVCMGMQVEEDCPDVYFCEQCRPELHIPLLRSLGLLPPPRSNKKGGSKGAKNSARELREAKEAIAALAQTNARRNQAEAAAAYQSRERRQGSHGKSTDKDPNRSRDSDGVPKSPKRRSTMNSRDSAYAGWEPIPPGLLNEDEMWSVNEDEKKAAAAKKRKRGAFDESMEENEQGTPDPSEETPGSADLAKRRRMSAGLPGSAPPADGEEETIEQDASGEADDAPRDRSKKKGKNGSSNGAVARENPVTAESAPAPKPRHPNQYTYRNKDKNATSGATSKGNSTSASNLTSNSPSPSPSKSRAESGRRSGRDAGAGSRTGTPAPGDGSRSHNAGMSWTLPDHLSHLAYLLPARANPAKPVPPRRGATSPQPFRALSSIEATTKVRFPGRRMTMGEMRKRVRNIGEYVTRSQLEAVDREKRMKVLGITAEQEEAQEKETVEGLPMSMQLMDELTRELIHFQKKYGQGPGASGGTVTV